MHIAFRTLLAPVFAIAIAAAAPPAAPPPARALSQENVRSVDSPGEHFKYLTVDTVDRWLLDGTKDEILRIDVRSSEFDPVLSLVQMGAAGAVAAVLIPEVDDDGSESHMLMRLPVSGSLAILVHGAGRRGGGNYRLYVERLTSAPIPDGEEYATGTLDANGNAHIRFQAKEGEIIVPRGGQVTEIIDPKGFSLPNWRGTFVARAAGEHYFRVRGRAGRAFRAGLSPVRQRTLIRRAETADTITDGGLDEWTFPCRPNQLTVVEVEGEGLEVRIVNGEFAEDRGLDRGPIIHPLPAHSKGLTQRFAFVSTGKLDRRLQIHSRTESPHPYRVLVRDPSQALPAGARIQQRLALGGAAYWTFAVQPGEVYQVDVESDDFDPYLRLSNGNGLPMGDFDDGGGDLSARYTWLVEGRGQVRAEVSCYGNGGGGDYRVKLTAVPVPTFDLESPVTGTLKGGTAGFWHVQAEGPQDLVIMVRSTTFQPALRLVDPDGITIATAAKSGIHRASLLSVTLPKKGRYTVAVTGNGAGAYTMRGIDPEK